MPVYNAPLRDMKFVMQEVLDIGSLQKYEKFAEPIVTYYRIYHYPQVIHLQVISMLHLDIVNIRAITNHISNLKCTRLIGTVLDKVKASAGGW
mgnify:CR=1 FL=1